MLKFLNFYALIMSDEPENFKTELKEEIQLSDNPMEAKKVDQFWIGIFLGLTAGVIGDLWVTFWFRWMDNLNSMGNMILAITATIVYLILVIYLYKKSIVKIKSKSIEEAKKESNTKEKPKRGIHFTKEKWFWIITIVIAVALLYNYIYPYFSIIEGVKQYNPSPLKINVANVYLDCKSIDSDFFIVGSNITCSVLVTSQVNLEDVGMIIRIFDSEDLLKTSPKPLWGCRFYIQNATNESIEFLPCRDPITNTFKPDKTGRYKFELYSFNAYYMGERSREIGFIDNNLESDFFFRGDLEVLSKKEEFSIKVANNSFLIAFIALITFIPTVIFEIRKFLMDK